MSCFWGVTGKHLVSGNDIKDYAKNRGGGQKVETLQAKRGTIYSSDNEVIASDVKNINYMRFCQRRV